MQVRMNIFTSSRHWQFWLYAVAVGLALMVRFVRLDAWPLTDEEARWAMQAFELVTGLRPEIGSQPGYTLLTALVFFVLQASEFTARLVPAIFGAALVIAPYFFRDQLGEKPALVLAFLVAFDPGFLALSRLAGSPMMAVSALLLAWGAWRNRYLPAAGILLGLALLGGPQVWAGLLGLAITIGLTRRLMPELSETQPVRETVLPVLAYAGGTVLTVGTLFFWAIHGLNGIVQSLSSYLSGWLAFSDVGFSDFVPAQRLWIALLVYQLPSVLLALIALLRGAWRRDALTLGLGIWLGVSLILSVANPARQVFDLAWTLVPLLALAASEAARYIQPVKDNLWSTLAMTAFTISLLAFAGINLSGLALNTLPAEQMQIRFGLMLAALTLLGVSILLVAFGWSIPVAVQGSIWGGLVMLTLWNLSTAMAAGGLRTYQTAEMWPPGLPARYAGALVEQLREIERWKLHPAQPLTVTISGVDSPALRWALRTWNPNVTFATALTDTPDVLIVPAQTESPELQENYRGQDFIWRTQAYWDEFQTRDWLGWLFHHRAIEGQEELILWVRSDLFIDAEKQTP
ncbi:MAG: hypothetical protein DDG60_03780 [Anaerolineae bacterium]|nr:MAG: hypothetical protein DDG60_03780 [Anaerolineae bacterium]